MTDEHKHVFIQSQHMEFQRVNKCCNVVNMNIGGRIVGRLNDLGLKRKDLLDRIPDLTSQALYNLIKRDSIRSEWDLKIAEALNVSVLWLVYGMEDACPSETESTVCVSAEVGSNIRAFTTQMHPAVDEVVQLMNATDELGKGMILGKVRDIAKERAQVTNKLLSST